MFLMCVFISYQHLASMRIDDLLSNPFSCPFGMNLVEVLLNNLLVMISNQFYY